MNSIPLQAPLGEVLTHLSTYMSSSFILVPSGTTLTPETPTIVVPIPEDPNEDVGIPGFEYLIEVFVAKDVLETWSSWRSGAIPNPGEAIQAIQYYQENDAFLPTDQMKRQGLTGE